MVFRVLQNREVRAYIQRPLRGKTSIDVSWKRQSGGGECNGVTRRLVVDKRCGTHKRGGPL